MTALENIKIEKVEKIKLESKKIIVEQYTTSEPLFKATEVIAIYSKSRDSRANDTLTIIMEPKALKLTNWDRVINGVIKAYDSGAFRPVGANKSLFYATLEPTASLLVKR